MGQITGDWQAALKNEFHQPYYAKLYKTIMEEYRTTKVFPPPQDMFNAFEYTPLNDVKVVILGQDPYHKQGVFLLNTVLTVRAHQAFSHRGIGWEQFTDAVIQTLNDQDRPIVYLLWGRPAQMKKAMLNNPKQLVLTAAHPSPLSASRGFFGCRHFSQTNEFLEKNGLAPIDWQIENIKKEQ